MEIKDHIEKQLHILIKYQDGPQQLRTKKEAESLMKNLDLDTIIKVLGWITQFIELYNKAFRNRKGEYRQAKWSKAWGITKAIFSLGLILVGFKKIK